MTHSHRVMVAIVPLQQNRLQRTNKSNDRGLSMMPSFARCLGALVAIGFTCIKLGDLSISPHSISQHQIVPTNLRTVPNMIKNSFSSVKALETNGTVQEIADIFFQMDLILWPLNECKANCCLEVATKGHPSCPQTNEVSGCSEELGDPCGGQ